MHYLATINAPYMQCQVEKCIKRQQRYTFNQSLLQHNVPIYTASAPKMHVTSNPMTMFHISFVNVQYACLDHQQHKAEGQ